MIYHLDPNKHYTNRKYLMQWFEQDVVVITDVDFNESIDISYTEQLITNHHVKNCVVDITHNVAPDRSVPFTTYPILTNNFEKWYQLKENWVFFPLWLWMYSTRNALWWPYFSFDAGFKKTQGIMCLNKNRRDHRTYLWDEFNRRQLVDKMMYTFEDQRLLPDESVNPARSDPSVDHWVYSQYTVNLVTETEINTPYISEKTCKPFVARQIPIIVGSQGINKFLQNIGLDMFEDIVPWHTWDNETDSIAKLQKIVDFVEHWINSGTILNDYQRVLSRVQRNKQYFHSETFRNIIMNQMSNFKPR